MSHDVAISSISFQTCGGHSFNLYSMTNMMGDSGSDLIYTMVEEGNESMDSHDQGIFLVEERVKKKKKKKKKNHIIIPVPLYLSPSYYIP